MDRKRQMGVLMAVLAMFGGAWAEHTAVLSGNTTYKYTVSDDGLTWTQGDKFNRSFQGAVVPGDGYVYAQNGQNGNEIHKFDATGTDKGKFVDAPDPEQLCMSADKVWIYSGSLAGAGTTVLNVRRYRLSDPTIGGLCISDAITSSAGPQVRQMACGNDGYLYLASRTLTGAYVYDPTLPTVQLVDTYKCGCAGGLVIDEKLGKMNIFNYNSQVCQFDLGDTATYKAITINYFDNPFASCKIGDMCFGSGWENGVVAKIGDGTATPVTFTDDKKIVNLSGMLCLDNIDTGTKLPNITGVWYMNGGSGSSCNGANPGKYDLVGYGGVRGNVDGVIRGGLYLGENAYGIFADSAAMFPSTGDFTFSTWAAFPDKAAAANRTILANGTASFALDAAGKFGFFAGETSICSETAVDDGKWHFLSVIRTGAKIQVWVDGTKETESDFASGIAIASASPWLLGVAPDNSAKLGKAWFDEIRVYPVALPASDIEYLIGIAAPNGIAQLATPSEPEELQYSKTEAEKLGDVVDHAFAGDLTVGATSLAKVEGTIYLSRDLGPMAGTPSAGSAFYKSTDNGVTWTKKPSVSGYSQMSLFVHGGSVFALALDSHSQLCLGTLGAEDAFTWEATTFTNSSMRACQPIVKDGRVWMGYHPADIPLGFGVVSAAFDGSSLSDIKALSSTNTFNQIGGSYSFYKKYLAGVPVVGTNNYVTVLSPVEMKSARSGLATAPEVNHHTIATSSTAAQYCVPIRFPGGAKPFAVVRDEQGGRYWAVTMPQHEADIADNVMPQTVQSKMALYSSPDLVEWRFHGDIADSGDTMNTGMSNPSVVISGDDLLISFAALVDDGTGCSTLAGESNFLLVKKVKNFRSKYVDTPFWPKDHKYLLAIQSGGSVAYNCNGSCVMKYYRDKTTGDWLPGGILIHNSGGQAIRTYGDKIYIGYWGGNLKEFSSDGVCLRTLKVCGTAVDGIAISPDGKYVYCSDQDSKLGDIYMVNTSSSNWTASKVVSDNDILLPRSLAMMSDGSLLAGGRNSQKLKRFYLKSDGTVDHSEEINSGKAYQTLCLSQDETKLLIGLNGSNISHLTLATGTREDFTFDYDVFDMAVYGDILFASTYGNSNSRPGGFGKAIYSNNNYTMRYIAPMPAAGGSRIAVLDVPKPGMVMLFK